MSCCSNSPTCSNGNTPATGLHYALVGFANSGKSTLFNLLTSRHKKASKQNVGNFSGVTVAAKKSPLQLNNVDAFLSDLPGLSSLSQRGEQGQDLTITQQFIQKNDIDCLINVVDINQISRQLYLTTQLLELGVPMIVVLNKVDRKKHQWVDVNKLSEELGCPVIALSALNKSSLAVIEKTLLACDIQAEQKISVNYAPESSSSIQARQDYVADILSRVSVTGGEANFTDYLDNIALHPVIGVPIFLGMMYLLFMFAINVGSAFIDFFDILSGTLFVAYPLHFLEPLNLPQWILTIVEGVGSGIQTVATFIPVIACFFIGFSL